MSPERKLALKLIAFGIFILFVCGCADDPPKQGYVRDKRFTPAHQDSHYEPGQCISRNKYGACTVQMPGHTVYVNVPDAWSLYLEDCKTDAKTNKQHCDRGWLPVDETTFHEFNVGQHYPDAR